MAKATQGHSALRVVLARELVIDEITDLADDVFALGGAGEEVIHDLRLVFLMRDDGILDVSAHR